MANRVLLSSAGLKVSRPGFDVLTAADRYLQFNSAAAHANVLLKGSATLTSGTSGQQLFGKTFSAMPLVFWSVEPTNGQYTQFVGTAEYMEDYDGINDPVKLLVLVLNNKIEWFTASGSHSLSGRPLRYVIFDNNV